MSESIPAEQKLDPFETPQPGAPRPEDMSKAELLGYCKMLEMMSRRLQQHLAVQGRDAVNTIATIVLAAGGHVIITKEMQDRVQGMQMGRAVLEDGSISLDLRDQPTEPEPAPATPEFAPDGL